MPLHDLETLLYENHSILHFCAFMYNVVFCVTIINCYMNRLLQKYYDSGVRLSKPSIRHVDLLVFVCVDIQALRYCKGDNKNT